MSQTEIESPVGNFFNKYQSAHPVERFLVGRFVAAVCSEVRSLRPSTILDAGCGEGILTESVRLSVPGVRITALDHGAELLAAARRENPAVNFMAGSILALPFTDGRFDLALATEVLEHLDTPGGALDELVRVARERVLLTVPLEPCWRMLNCLRGRYLRQWGNTPGHLQHWSRAGFHRFLDARLDRVRIRTVFPWLLATGVPRR